MDITMTFVLTGVRAGETCILAKRYHFVNGECTVRGSVQAVTGMRKILAMYYQAHPKDSVELKEARRRYGQCSVDKRGTEGNPKPVPSSIDAAAGGTAQAATDGGDGYASSDAGETEILPPGDGRESELLAAVDLLDHNNDGHWTKEGAPRLDIIANIVGRQVTRKEIERAYPGYVRGS